MKSLDARVTFSLDLLLWLQKKHLDLFKSLDRYHQSSVKNILNCFGFA